MTDVLQRARDRYRNWMVRWEERLVAVSTDRVRRPFDFGLEWTLNWPLIERCEQADPEGVLACINREVLADSDAFYGYEPPADFELRKDGWLQFSSPAPTPYPENNQVQALWFPAKRASRRRRAVVVLPHWNSRLPQHNALCAGLQRLGISALRLSLPYHDGRMPTELARADYAVSSNICRTIDATRQAVLDIRSCYDWLEQQGFERLGILGTSLGSCYAFLAAAHDSRIRTCVFNHCSTYFADVVWEGLSTRHVRAGLEGAVDLDTLRSWWRCISPPSFYEKFTALRPRSKFIYTTYDTTFPVHLSRQVIEGARKNDWDHAVAVLPCGHYTMGEFPFKFLTGYEICSFLLSNL